VTDIPEHLLRRSKERRSAATGEGGESGEATPSAAAPAKVEAAAAPAAPPPTVPAQAPPLPKAPTLPVGRARMPIWAMPVVVMLPVFAFFYAQAFNPPAVVRNLTPEELGAELYVSTGCSGCHGGAGEGGVGPKLSEGEVELTFPDEKDHAGWIKSGSAPFAGQGYGAANRPGGQRKAAGSMPAFPQLTDEEIDALVLYEREKL